MSKDLQELIKNKELTQEQKNEILLTAAEEGNLEIIRQAIEELGADVNATTRGGHTSFIVAANRGHIKVIEELYVNYGADVNAVANDGWTALRYVVQCGGNLEVVRALLSCKDIDVNITDKYNKAPLLIALRNGRSEISKLLIEHPSNRMSQEQKNEVLLTAAQKGNSEITRKAVELGADVNAKDNDGNIALHHAVENNNLEIARLLLANGASMTAENLYGETALGLANYKGHQGMITLLEAAQRAPKPQKRKIEVEDVDTKRAQVEKATEKVAEKAAEPQKRKIEVEDVDAKRTRVEKEAEKEVEKATEKEAEKVAEKAAKPSKRKMDVKGEETVDTSKKPHLEEAQVTEIFRGLSFK